MCGGGRYDYLVEELGGKTTPAFGFAAGIERLILALNKKHLPSSKSSDIYIVITDKKYLEYSLKISESLRKENLVVINDFLLFQVDRNFLRNNYFLISL